MSCIVRAGAFCQSLVAQKRILVICATIAVVGPGCFGCRSKDGQREISADAGRALYVGAQTIGASKARDAGPNVVLALDPGAPSGIALDQNYVYWTSYSSGKIQRIPKAGGSPQVLAAARVLGVPSLAVDDKAVYFSAREDAGVTTYVGWIPKSGGAITTIASHLGAARRVKVSDGFVYWLVDPQPRGGGGVARAPIGGGRVQSITPSTYAADAWLAVDDQYAYWTAYGDKGRSSGHIYRTPRDGSGAVAVLGSGLDSPYAIAADARNIFVGLGFALNVANGMLDGAIITLDKMGTPPVPTTTLAKHQAQPLELAVDDTSVYWGDHISGALMKAPKAGGAAVMLTTGSGFESLAVDDQYVYWTFCSVGNGYVARVLKNAP
jgi:hypothetical protein